MATDEPLGITLAIVAVIALVPVLTRVAVWAWWKDWHNRTQPGKRVEFLPFMCWLMFLGGSPIGSCWRWQFRQKGRELCMAWSSFCFHSLSCDTCAAEALGAGWMWTIQSSSCRRHAPKPIGLDP